MKRRSAHIGDIVTESSRLVLRQPTPGTVDELVSAVVASKALHEPWVFAPATRATAAAWVERVKLADTEAHVAYEHDRLVAVVNINNIVRGGLMSGALGYYGFAGATGRGVVREAVGLVVRRAFDDLGLHRLEANIQPTNTASRKLASALGFRLEGFSPGYLKIAGAWRDHERWALLSTDEVETGPHGSVSGGYIGGDSSG